MSLKTKVKVGNITSLSSARYCAGMGVDFLGFNIGANGLNPVSYKEIIEWVSGPQFVIEAQRDQTLTLEDITNNYPGHFIEINKDQIAWLDNGQYEFILWIDEKDWPALEPTVRGKTNLKYIEMSCGSPDSLLPESVPVIFLLRDTGWLEHTAQLPVFAISLMSTDEERPGLMDYEGIAEVLELLEEN